MVAIVVAAGAAAAAFQVDPDVVVKVSTPPTGLWIPAPGTGEIVRVDVGSGGVTARVRVSEPGAELELAERDNGVVVVDRTAGRVALVDPALHQIVREVRTVAADSGLVDIGAESIVMASGDEVAVVGLDVTGAFRASVPGPVRSIASLGTGMVAENGADQLEIDSQGVVGIQEESSGILVRVRDRVVVLTVDGVEDRSGTLLSCPASPLENLDQVIGSAEGWIVAIDGPRVRVADLNNGECTTVRLDAEVGALGTPVVAGRRIYVPESAAGIVHVIEPSRRSVRSFSVFAPGDLRLRSRGEFVIAYDAGRAVAAVLDADGVVRFIDTGGTGITAVLDEGGSVAVVGGDDSGADVAVDGAEGATASSDALVLTARVLAAALGTSSEEEVDDLVPDDSLVANFAFSATTVTVGESVRFVDDSSGMPDSWLWDFGDGTGAEGPEVEKAWDEAGTFAVTLRITRGDESAEISLAIIVVASEVSLPPAADFALSASVVAVGDSIDFEDRSAGEIDRWRWDFGDGTTATAPNVSKVWGASGVYTVSLTVANEQGSDFASVVVQVVEGLRAPVARIAVPENEVDLGAPLSFSGSSATDAASFTWDFGDGHTSGGATVVHVFLEEGIFTVRLTAENDAGSSTALVEILVTPPTLPPSAAIATLPSVIEVGDVVSLSSLSTNSPDTEGWSFGDGDSASGSEVTHTWTAPGTYLLTLIASNAAGTDSVIQTVEVVAQLPAPLAQIGNFDASPWVGEPAVFFDASIDAAEWSWDFGDGATSTAQNPLHTFTSAGQKIVTLTVSNRNGTNSASVVVEPRLRPIAGFVASSIAIRAGDEVVFTDGSVNAVTWFWSFGDGTVSGSQNPTNTYTATGSYSVLLTIENATGDSDTFGPVVINVDPALPLLSGIRALPDDSGVITTLTAVAFEAEVAATSGPIDQYQIDFGDGSPINTGSASRVSYIYTERGSYEVRMKARGPLGDWSDWVTRSFAVVDPPPPLVAIAGSVPTSALVGDVTLTGVELSGSGPIVNWEWVVTGVGNVWYYAGQVAVHNFQAAGIYTITLTAEGPVSDVVVARDITITVPPAPTIVSLTADPSPTTTGVVVNFTPVVTGSVSTWEWDFEGGGYVALGPAVSYIFNTSGPQTVILRITGPFGGQDVMSVALTVNPQPTPTVPIASPAGTITTGTTVNLSSTDGSGLSGLIWDWQVTNGTTTSNYPNAGQSTPHLFDTAGSWTVTVTATDPLGEVGTAVLLLTVQDPVPPLVASFTSIPSGGPLQIQFTDTSTGSPDSWSWDFGDPLAVGDSTAPNPLVTYPAPGLYTVTLTVSSGGGAPDAVVVVVTVS